MRSFMHIYAFFKYWIWYQTFVCLLEAKNVTICDTIDIQQCILCANCENPSNETQKLCRQPTVTKFFEENPQYSIKDECYEYGAHADFIHGKSKSSHISILPPHSLTNGSKRCYFNIYHYNATQTEPTYLDTACVEYGSGQHEILSKHKLWKVEHRLAFGAQSFKYDIEATKGKLLFHTPIENSSLKALT